MLAARVARVGIAVAAAAAVVIAAVALYINARHYFPFIADDAYISLRYAHRLIHGHGLTWTAGPPVEGYSNLLWTLLCAFLGALGINLVTATRILGGLGMSAVFGAILWAVFPRRLAAVGAALAAMLGFAVAGPVGAWAVGGLEQPLVAALLAWSIVTCAPLVDDEAITRRQVILPGTLLALLTLARVDAAILVAGLCLALVVVHRFRRCGWQRGLLLAVLPLATFLAQMVFRVTYYDSFVPNTARVKVAFTSARLHGGWDYVASAASISVLLLAIAALPILIGGRWRGPRWRLACVAWIVAAVWAAYILIIGGDIFPAYRHWVAVLAAVSIAAALGLALITEHKPRVGWLAVGIAIGAVALSATRQRDDPENHRAVTERWEQHGEVVGKLLRDAFREQQPLVAAAAVGSLCYYAELPCLDMYGLNDRHIAQVIPDDFGTGLIGHELGDGPYILSRQPDLMLFCGPTGRRKGCGRGAKELGAMPEFHRQYQFVLFLGKVPFRQSARVWVRRAGLAGVVVTPNEVTMPGYLLSGPRKSMAQLDDQGRLIYPLPAGSKARGSITLAAGRWQVHVEAEPAEALTIMVTSAGQTSAAATPFVAAGENSPVRVEIRAGETTNVRQLVFERAP